MRVSLCFRAEGEYKEETMAGEKDLEKAKE